MYRTCCPNSTDRFVGISGRRITDRFVVVCVVSENWRRHQGVQYVLSQLHRPYRWHHWKAQGGGGVRGGDHRTLAVGQFSIFLADVYLASYSDCLTSFGEPLPPPYRAFRSFLVLFVFYPLFMSV